jgi:hypothetical protein
VDILRSAVADLTADELRRIQNTLRARYDLGSRTNILDIGFGAALQRGKLRPDRGLCITFLVRAKRDPSSKSDRIPPAVTVRVKRGRRFVPFSFGTDVVEVGQLAATGSRLEYRSKTVTTGLIVAWHPEASGKLSWGVVTVGHIFPRLRTLSKRNRQVTIRTGRGHFFGRLVAQSADNQSIDAAIALVDRQDLIAHRLLAKPASVSSMPPRRIEQLISDQHKIGETLRTAGARRFTVHAYFPTLRVTDIGTLQHMISVISEAAQTFQKGTSGTSWLIQNQAACQQVAGRTPAFRQGFGQALVAVTEWAAKELHRHDLMRPGSLRLVSVW